MDSISQLGLNEVGDYPDAGGIDLGQIRSQLQAREMKIKSLIADKKKLKSLLVKAKGAIDDINQKYRMSESNLQGAKSQIDTLQKTLDDFQRRRNGIEKNMVAQILSRVKVGEIGYTLIQDV